VFVVKETEVHTIFKRGQLTNFDFFLDCISDGHPNSYIVFYLNYTGISTTPSQNKNQLMGGWIARSKDIDPKNYMDHRFYSGIEMHISIHPSVGFCFEMAS
jgi:hypothetical protein